MGIKQTSKFAFRHFFRQYRQKVILKKLYPDWDKNDDFTPDYEDEEIWAVIVESRSEQIDNRPGEMMSSDVICYVRPEVDIRYDDLIIWKGRVYEADDIRREVVKGEIIFKVIELDEKDILYDEIPQVDKPRERRSRPKK